MKCPHCHRDSEAPVVSRETALLELKAERMLTALRDIGQSARFYDLLVKYRKSHRITNEVAKSVIRHLTREGAVYAKDGKIVLNEGWKTNER